MIQTFINKPVLATVISIVITFLGILGYIGLPVAQYPDIAPPTVSVTTSYPGANAETILESVIVPIEEEINGVEGMTYMKSTSSNDGSATITIFFEQGINPDIAAVNVQNRVARATSTLPSEVVRNGVITEKKENSSLLYMAMYSDNPDYNETFVFNYFDIYIKPELQRINGVAAVTIFGDKEYSMRVWVDPAKMANYGITIEDVVEAINDQSLEASAGALGQNVGEPFEFVIKYKGRYKTEEEYENIIIKNVGNGKLLKLSDVASLELDAFNYSSTNITVGSPSVSFGIFQTPGSNAQIVIENIHKRVAELSSNFPEGVKTVVNFDTNNFLEASLEKVFETLIEAFILVFLVVLLFLQDFKSTLIPAISVPVSIVGTFFFLNLFGYSLNLLTMFALVLAIGIVVDDAIVVVEAVHSKLNGAIKDPKKAASVAMSEISGAIISITLIMGAVFIPITFLEGPSGVFFRQFGVTLIIAILISAVNALTLSPALCALLLKPHQADEHSHKNFLQRFYSAFNVAFDATKAKYVLGVKFLIHNKWITGVAILACLVSIVYINGLIPTGFVPPEDKGVIFVNMELPVGTSLDRTYAITKELTDSTRNIPGVNSVTYRSGGNFFSGNSSNNGQGFVLLKGYEERQTEETSLNGILAALRYKTRNINSAKIIFFPPPSIPGFGSAEGVEFQILDKSSGDFVAFDKIAKSFVSKLSAQPSVSFASNSLCEYPAIGVEHRCAKSKGVRCCCKGYFFRITGFYRRISCG